jgi:hypothetical protein
VTKKSLKAEVNSFSKGLITEASPLNFPENAASAIDNFVLNRDGTINRRLGLDIEEGGVWKDWGIGPDPLEAATPYKWVGAGGSITDNFLVLQAGSMLFFYRVTDGPINLENRVGFLEIQHTISNSNSLKFSSINGKLVVVGGSPIISIITYDTSAVTFSYKTARISVRDLWGVEEKISVGYENDYQFRDSVDPNIYHQYNLANQSWGIPRANTSGTLADPVKTYKDALGVYPSNSELVWTGMYYQPGVGGAAPFERQYPNSYKEAFGAAPKAAQGYFILDLFNRGISRRQVANTNKAKYPEIIFPASQVHLDLIPDDLSYGGVGNVVEFAGRAFFSGFAGASGLGDQRSPDLSNHVAFSQLVRKTDDITKCYQQGDPTSRDSADLIDTDGGLIRVAGATQITGMVALSNALIIFAANGVWALTGGSDYGFTATNYKLEKVTSFGTMPIDNNYSRPSHSIVADGSRAYYWSVDGIYTIGKDQMGGWAAQNITQQTIQGLYDGISNRAKSTVRGVYEVSHKRIRWLWREGTIFTASSQSRELILDLNIGAFYTHTIAKDPQNFIEVIAPFISTSYVSSIHSSNVMAGVDNVQMRVAGPDFPVPVFYDYDIAIPDSSREEDRIDVRYFCVKNVPYDGVTYKTPYWGLATYHEGTFKDWVTYDNVGFDAKGVLATGAITAGDSSVVKQVPYLVLHYRRTEKGLDVNFSPLNQSGCLVRSQWDWANSIVSNKWGPKFQGYRYRQAFISNDGVDYNTGFDVVTTRNKLRGRGKAFSLYMETEAGKDCQILGWNLSLNGNSIT